MIQAVKTIRIYILSLLLCLCGGVVAVAQSAAENATVQVEQHASIKALNGAVEIDNATGKAVDVAVFAITGSLVKQVTIDSGESLRIELPSGYYIVKAGDTLKRVAVR